MKAICKSVIIFIIIIVLFGSYSNTFASDTNVRLNIIQNASEIKLDNDQGYITKTIVDSNSETGEVTIEVKVSNTSKKEENVDNTEVIFVIDNSSSMNYKGNTKEVRKDLVIKSAKNLASSIFKQLSNVKIGIVKFTGVGNSVGAGINNATLVQALSDDEDTVLKGIQKIANSQASSGTNIDAGLQRANNNFSQNAKNKIIVLFTDGIPNADVKGTHSSSDTTSEKSLIVQTNTKNTIKNIANSGVYLISMMTGINADSKTYESDMNAITNIFGTTSNPTSGKFYNISDTEIQKIVENDILIDIIGRVQNSFNEVKLLDYFPREIIENFEFTYVEQPSIGKVSNSIDKKTNSIIWNIGTIEESEVVTLKYKLKVKNMSKESPIYNKELATNEKIVLTYTDSQEQEYQSLLLDSPKIKLIGEEKEEAGTIEKQKNQTETPIEKTEDKKDETEVKKDEKEEKIEKVEDEEKVEKVVPKDTTVANEILPYTGISLIVKMTIVEVFIIAILSLRGYINYKKTKK